MPDQIASQFEHQALEQDIKRLAVEIQAHRDRPETQGVDGREIIKQTIKTMVPNDAPAPAVASPANVISNPLPDYAISAPAETKLEIEYLLELAFHQGILKANTQAQKSSPFVIDAFHDALAGKLHEEMKKRGMVE
jgi:hypothetical protein